MPIRWIRYSISKLIKIADEIMRPFYVFYVFMAALLCILHRLSTRLVHFSRMTLTSKREIRAPVAIIREWIDAEASGHCRDGVSLLNFRFRFTHTHSSTAHTWMLQPLAYSTIEFDSFSFEPPDDQTFNREIVWAVYASLQRSSVLNGDCIMFLASAWLDNL